MTQKLSKKVSEDSDGLTEVVWVLYFSYDDLKMLADFYRTLWILENQRNYCYLVISNVDEKSNIFTKTGIFFAQIVSVMSDSANSFAR